jgi:hypothetical protein
MSRYAVAVLAVALGAFAPPPAGEDGGAALDAYRLSAELSRAASRSHDPYLLLAAARLRRSVEVTADDGAPDRALEWLDQAQALGAEDLRVLDMAQEIRSELRKGRAQGPHIRAASLKAGERTSFVETFKPGANAVVYVEGDGDTDLTLRVGTACRDDGPGDVKICAWKPARAAQVRIEIGNSGRVENRVIIGTN